MDSKDAEKLENPITNSWMNSYLEIIEYLNKNNTLPTYRESSLGVWVGAQRKLYREKKLHQEKIELLEKLKNWEWQVRSYSGGYGESNWGEMYSKLKDFCLINNRLPSRSDDLSIANWKEKKKTL